MKTPTHISNPLQHWQSLVNGQRTRHRNSAKQREFQEAGTLNNLLLPGIPNEVLMFVNRTCAALGGANHMTLAEWRDAEEQLVRKIQDEKRNAYS